MLAADAPVSVVSTTLVSIPLLFFQALNVFAASKKRGYVIIRYSHPDAPSGASLNNVFRWPWYSSQLRNMLSWMLSKRTECRPGDIGKTSSAYAKEAFDFWEADSLTVAPYMGADSVGPFIKECETRGKGVYVLNRTSNKGAAEIQNLKVEEDLVEI